MPCLRRVWRALIGGFSSLRMGEPMEKLTERAGITAQSLPALSRSLATRVGFALGNCATLRGGTLDKETLKLYTAKLIRYDVDDVMLALEKLSEMPREEYQSAIPDIGGIIALVQVCRNARINRAEADKNKKLFYFSCSICGHSESAYFIPTDPRLDRKRICKSIYGPIGSTRGEDSQFPHTQKILTRGVICGHVMTCEQFESYEEAVAKREKEGAYEHS